MQINNCNNPYNYNNPSFQKHNSPAIKNAPEITPWGWDKEERREEIKKEYNSIVSGKLKRRYPQEELELYKNKFETECNIASFIERYKDTLYREYMYPSDEEQINNEDRAFKENKQSESQHIPDAFDYGYSPDESDENCRVYEIVWDLNKDSKENADNASRLIKQMPLHN